MKQLVLLISIVGIISSCSTTITTPSGTTVSYLSQGSPDNKLKHGSILSVKAHYRTDTDQTIVMTEEGEPAFLQYDSTQSIERGGLVQEVFNMLNVGDSVYFEVPATNLWVTTFRRPLPDSIDQDAIVKINLKIEDQMTISEYRQYAAELEKQQNEGEYAADVEGLVNYLTDNKIEPEVLESGLRYVITNTTSGRYPNPGEKVSVKYKGMLLDGSVFDEGTYTFPLGMGQVIAGWDEGIGFLRKGEKGVLYIPSELGYGSRGSGARIPPFSSLVFEVELVDIIKDETAN